VIPGFVTNLVRGPSGFRRKLTSKSVAGEILPFPETLAAEWVSGVLAYDISDVVARPGGGVYAVDYAFGELSAFAPDGTGDWTASGIADNVRTIAVDESGNVYLACQAGSYQLVSYDPAGTFRWGSEPAPWAFGTVGFSGGFVFIDGTVSSSEDRLYKIDPSDGSVVAESVKFDDNKASARGIAPDGEGGVWITLGGEVASRSLVKHFDADLNYVEQIDHGQEIERGLAYDAKNGFIYTASARVSGATLKQWDASALTVNWAESLETGSETRGASHITLDRTGDVYVAVKYYSSSNTPRVVRFDSEGNRINDTSTVTDTGGGDYFTSVAVDENGMIYAGNENRRVYAWSQS